MAKKMRKFGGKNYYLLYPDKTTSWSKPMRKRLAENIASNEREGGRSARVVRITGGYAVYVRNR